MQVGQRLLQKNEGHWKYTVEESGDARSIELEVDVGPYLDTSLIRADVQPLFVRLLIKVYGTCSLSGDIIWKMLVLQLAENPAKPL